MSRIQFWIDNISKNIFQYRHFHIFDAFFAKTKFLKGPSERLIFSLGRGHFGEQKREFDADLEMQMFPSGKVNSDK